ncbi:hypothetical protein GUITHDRAFT_46292, partial [Guillardia theta CCMP2712]
DPYKILGVRRGTSKAECKRQYRRLAQQYHPDKCLHCSPEKLEEMAETFIRIQAAWEQIS